MNTALLDTQKAVREIYMFILDRLNRGEDLFADTNVAEFSVMFNLYRDSTNKAIKEGFSPDEINRFVCFTNNPIELVPVDEREHFDTMFNNMLVIFYNRKYHIGNLN